MISWNYTKEESDLVDAILRRFCAICEETAPTQDEILEFRMDLLAVHCNDVPLDFQRMLDGRDFDLVHDVCGINGTIDRRTGKINREPNAQGRNFRPRYTRRQEA